eukprot:1160261-Pelagomonas_calceolata.AAC.12
MLGNASRPVCLGHTNQGKGCLAFVPIHQHMRVRVSCLAMQAGQSAWDIPIRKKAAWPFCPSTYTCMYVCHARQCKQPSWLETWSRAAHPPWDGFGVHEGVH